VLKFVLWAGAPAPAFAGCGCGSRGWEAPPTKRSKVAPGQRPGLQRCRPRDLTRRGWALRPKAGRQHSADRAEEVHPQISPITQRRNAERQRREPHAEREDYFAAIVDLSLRERLLSKALPAFLPTRAPHSCLASRLQLTADSEQLTNDIFAAEPSGQAPAPPLAYAALQGNSDEREPSPTKDMPDDEPLARPFRSSLLQAASDLHNDYFDGLSERQCSTPPRLAQSPFTTHGACASRYIHECQVRSITLLGNTKEMER
jgi:hypothetical protein